MAPLDEVQTSLVFVWFRNVPNPGADAVAAVVVAVLSVVEVSPMAVRSQNLPREEEVESGGGRAGVSGGSYRWQDFPAARVRRLLGSSNILLLESRN